MNLKTINILELSQLYSPWSDGLNERNHYSTNRIVQKFLDEGVFLELDVSRACWTQNTYIMVSS